MTTSVRVYPRFSARASFPIWAKNLKEHLINFLNVWILTSDYTKQSQESSKVLFCLHPS